MQSNVNSYNAFNATLWFWNKVEQVRASPLKPRDVLGMLSNEELERFSNEFDLAYGKLWDAPIETILYSHGLSESGLLQILYWVVSQGFDYYMRILSYPSEIPRKLTREQAAEILYGTAYNVYYERTGEELPLWDSPGVN